jgi:hypothetical protein
MTHYAAIVLLLFGLSTSAYADNEPTLVRLSFWMSPEQKAVFADIYETEVGPLLLRNGLMEETTTNRTALDSVFSRLFVVNSYAEALKIEQTLAADSVWLAALEGWGKTLGISALRTQFRVIRMPAGPEVAAGPGFRQGVWQTFSVEDGLPGSMVVETIQDRSGDLWFAVSPGVCRYDGYSFTTFTKADGLASDAVGTMLEDRSGNVWFATYGGGVSCYDGEVFKTFNTQDGLAGDIVTSIVEDRVGDVWFGTYGGGVSRYDGKAFTNFTAKDGLVDNWIVSISEDNAGQLWFGTNGGGHLELGGVSRYDGQSFTNFSAEHNIYAGYMYDTVEGRDGHLWMARYPSDLTRFDGQHFVDFTTVNGLANNGVIDIFEDRSGTLWISRVVA